MQWLSHYDMWALKKKTLKHAPQIWYVYTRCFLGRFSFSFILVFCLLMLFGYEIIIANSYPMRARGIIAKYYVLLPTATKPDNSQTAIGSSSDS